MRKSIISYLIVSATILSYASGVYFISGGDFRIPNIKYTITTQYPGQDAIITPSSVRTLTINAGNKAYDGPWSIKTKGQEIDFGNKANINQSPYTVGSLVENNSNGATNIAPYSFTYEVAGNHICKLYDEKQNIYLVQFVGNPNLTKLFIDWRDLRCQSQGITPRLSVSGCTNLVDVTIGYPSYSTNITLGNFSSCTNLLNLTILNPDNITKIDGTALHRCANLTNDFHLANVTYVGAGGFANAKNVRSIILPRVETIAVNAFNNSGNPWGQLGVVELGIGDKLTSVAQNALYANQRLETIYFYTDNEDDYWVSIWNNHPILPNWLGTITLADGQTQVATIELAPWTSDTTYYTSSGGRPTGIQRVIHRAR